MIQVLSLEPQPVGEVITGRDEDQIQHHLAGVPLEREVLQQGSKCGSFESLEILRVIGGNAREIQAHERDQNGE